MGADTLIRIPRNADAERNIVGLLLLAPLRVGEAAERLALPPREVRKSPRYFNAEETRRIIAAAREPYATIYAVAAMTGMRAGELLGLRITDIDFERRLIMVQQSLWHGKLQSVKSAMKRKGTTSS